MIGRPKMQITIVQAEIEAAIINHLRNIMTINDGMDISIDLSATRGAEGFKATIDIMPRSQAVEVPSQPVLEAKPTVKAAVQAAKTAAPAPVAEPIPEAPEVAPSVDQGETPADEPEAGLDQSGEAMAAEEAPKPKSLFGDVKRPVSA